MTQTASEATHLLPVEKLKLDERNPRLPERLREKSQSELLKYLYDNAALDEIATSYVDNGFFQNEPLIVIPDDSDETHLVVEGNRRLAALKILLESPEADDLRFINVDPSDQDLQELQAVPCFTIHDRDDVHSYVGFRHIGAIKTWPPEAKARYLYDEVERLVAERQDDEPFRELGRRVGSNAQGVRNPYLAIRILLHAREQFGVDVSYVQERRFGVWLRCMNSSDIRGYIGLGRATSYQEIERATEAIAHDKLIEVLGDLKPKSGAARAILGDSRDVTVYGRVLQNERANATLRTTGTLSLAEQIVRDAELDARARELTQRVQLFVDGLHGAAPSAFSRDVLGATEELYNISRSAVAIVRNRIEERDTDP